MGLRPGWPCYWSLENDADDFHPSVMPLVLKHVPVHMPKVQQVAVDLLCGVRRPVAPSLVRSLFTEAAGGGLALASPAEVN